MSHSTAVPRLARWKAGLTLLVAAVAATGAASTAGATTYTPTNGAQLITAVNSANSNPGLDTIQLGPIIYQPTSPIPTITDNLLIKGNPQQQAPPRAQIDGGFVNPLQSDLFTVAAGKKLTFKDATVVGSGDIGNFSAFNVHGAFELDNAVISGNNGKAVTVDFGASWDATNSTIDDNNDFAITILGTANFNNVTVAYNNGGIDSSSGTLNVTNSIITDNDALGAGTPSCITPVNTSDHSINDDGTCGTDIAGSPGQLGLINNHGGPTPTLVPVAGSPAIDGGSNAKCPTVDQRYFVRNNGACDVGAYEVGAARDTTAPTCVVTALRNGPPKQQDVTAQDTGSGLASDAISNMVISNGTVAFTPFTNPSRSGLVLTATKTDQTQLTRWSFTATDFAANSANCK
jgi:hypothetical protein